MNGSEKPDLRGYCQSESLLFQFILAEFLTTYGLIQQLENAYAGIEAALIKNRMMGQIRAPLERLSQLIGHLLGSANLDDDAFPWAVENGCLAKLYHYGIIYHHRAETNRRMAENISGCISKAFHSALQSREVLAALLYRGIDAKAISDYSILYNLLDKLIDNIQRGSRLLVRTIVEYRHDENVAFFLLRHRHEFHALYDRQFLTKMFQKMYPRGIAEAKEFLLKRYADRGHTEILEGIIHASSELEMVEVAS